MARKVFYCIFLLTIFNVNPADGFFSWLFDEKSEENDVDSGENSLVPLGKKSVPFEMKTTDEKFLMEANFANNLSPLDLCHHKVIAELRSSCSKLTEEGLAKLAVRLLNCQSESEGRKTFPCTSHMKIADCTRDMDPTTWNAYQIVSNRARAICYSVTQQQFRYRTERTVNRLASTTAEQLDSMKQIQDGQDELSKVTKDTLTQMNQGQQKLMTNQERLKMAQVYVNQHVVGNLRELTKEKALIAAGHKDLAEMTEGIKEKLDETTKQLSQQEHFQKENHEEIINDLLSIREKAKEVWQKLDNSSQDVLNYHNETTNHYRSTLENLEKINHTIHYVVNTLEDTKDTLETKMNWILSLLGATGDRVTLLWVVLLHLLYFLLAAMSAAFLQTPLFSRLLLMLLVPLNAWSQIKQGASLGFLPMTLFILLTVVANWLVNWGWYVYCCLTERHKVAVSPPALTGVPKHSPLNDSVCMPPPTPGTNTSESIITHDVRRLLTVLEHMCQSHVTPKCTPDSQMHESNPLMTPDLDPIKTSLSMISFLERQVSAATPTDAPPTPMPEEESILSASPRVDKVKRRLMTTLDSQSSPRSRTRQSYGLPKDGKDLTPSLTSTPIKELNRSSVDANPTTGTSSKATPSRATPSRATPSKATPSKASLSTSSSSAANLSAGPKHVCLAMAKSGRPCRLASMVGSGFCHRHQVGM